MAVGELFDTYMGWLDETECPRQYHRWSLVSAISTLLGRKLVFGEGTALQTYANQYIVLVGPPASRKNTAMKFTKDLLREVGYDKFASDRSSKEKFIMDLQTGFAEEGEADAVDFLENMDFSPEMEAQINAPELQDFLGMGNMDFISFLTNMWDMPEKYKHRLKNSKSSLLVKPTINLVGGATPTTLSEIFPTSVGGQGFLSRALMIFGKGARKKIAFPTIPDEETRLLLAAVLDQIKTHATGNAWLTPSAKEMLEDIYHSWAPLKDIRLETYSGRRFTSLIKNCMVVAASELSFDRGVKITDEHVLYANSMLAYAETFMSRALGNFGTSHTLEQQNKILGAMEASKSGLRLEEIFAAVNSEVNSLHQVADIMRHLATLEKVECNTETKQWYSVDAGLKAAKHVNYDLLIEGREYFEELEK